MMSRSNEKTGGGKATDAKREREERLAAALRDNLRRRKQQARDARTEQSTDDREDSR